VIANDTGPAHIAAHLGTKGIVLFGSHVSAKKVSIETKTFKVIENENLKDLSVDTVFKSIQNQIFT
jgi:ADP-heptose:LPS heptosyltransferase